MGRLALTCVMLISCFERSVAFLQDWRRIDCLCLCGNAVTIILV